MFNEHNHKMMKLSMDHLVLEVLKIEMEGIFGVSNFTNYVKRIEDSINSSSKKEDLLQVQTISSYLFITNLLISASWSEVGKGVT